MFDDQPNQAPGAGAPPTNLPIGEPEDMFGDAEPTVVPSPPSLPAPMPVAAPAAPSAVDAGMLKPKMPSAAAEPMVHTPPAEMTQIADNIREPKTAKRIMRLVLILVGVAVLVGVIWFIFGWVTRFTSAPAAPAQTSPIVIPELSDVPPADPTPTAPAANPDDQTAANPADDTILFGEPIDADGDNLDQARELTIGTDPGNWDTDGDGLNDGDEVIIWKTDPTNPDTDGDTYLDGAEVRNGYSPTGPGKLFQPPSGT